MSFYGKSFSFDGISCEEYGLMLYDFDSTTQGDSSYASLEVEEDRVAGRYRSLFYQTYYNKPLEFKLVFGADEFAAEAREPLDRYDLQLISAWLTDRKEYCDLVIDQPDMERVKYRCIITGLKVLEHANNQWAFEATVHCDSPYGYLTPQEFTYTVNGTSDIIVPCRSSANRPILPKVKLEMNDASVSIVNHDDGDREFKLENLPQSNEVIVLDGETGVMTCNSGANLYPYCNFKFPRLVRGDNHMKITGKVKITFTCECPVMVGG